MESLPAAIHRQVAAELSAFARYYDRVLQVHPLPHDDGDLLARVDAKEKRRIAAEADIPDLGHEVDDRSLFLLNGALNHTSDVEGLLARLHPKVGRGTRVAVVLYNPYQRGLFWAANRLGLRRGEAPSTFLTLQELRQIFKLAGFEIVRVRPTAFGPGPGALGRALRVAPGARGLSVAWVVLLRALGRPAPGRSLSIVVPARNEKGNIENAVRRLAGLRHLSPELVFVEGHSTDGTWEEILRVKAAYSGTLDIQAHRQLGKGKNDAVRLGFQVATRELLTILDADLTMPPELLGRFHDAYARGFGDFVNGNRLVYPMEDGAMRPLNHLGNVFFAKALSYVLDAGLGDSLCGTKLLSRRDYQRIVAWRSDFGDFDPFGDFELLFPAAVLGLGVVEIPIRYRNREYGQTNIHRLRDGARLMKMTAIGLTRIKAGS